MFRSPEQAMRRVSIVCTHTDQMDDLKDADDRVRYELLDEIDQTARLEKLDDVQTVISRMYLVRQSVYLKEAYDEFEGGNKEMPDPCDVRILFTGYRSKVDRFYGANKIVLHVT